MIFFFWSFVFLLRDIIHKSGGTYIILVCYLQIEEADRDSGKKNNFFLYLNEAACHCIYAPRHANRKWNHNKRKKKFKKKKNDEFFHEFVDGTYIDIDSNSYVVKSVNNLNFININSMASIHSFIQYNFDILCFFFFT